MAKSGEQRPSRHFLQSLRCHVLSPPTTALKTVRRERDEIRAERRAFESFAERVDDVPCDAPAPDVPTMVVDNGSGAIERVRTAYRETVMDTDHYEDVYDNTLRADIASEFGPGVAAALCSDTPVQFTGRLQQFLLAAVEESVTERETVLERLDDEDASLTAAKDELVDIVDNLDGTQIPQWYANTFTERLDRLAADRQETLRSHRSLGRLDGHSLCEHLYADEPWTYPVLTAVGRVREAVVL